MGISQRSAWAKPGHCPREGSAFIPAWFNFVLLQEPFCHMEQTLIQRNAREKFYYSRSSEDPRERSIFRPQEITELWPEEASNSKLLFSPYVYFCLTQVIHKILTRLLSLYLCITISLPAVSFPLLAFLTDHLKGTIMMVVLLLLLLILIIASMRIATSTVLCTYIVHINPFNTTILLFFII